MSRLEKAANIVVIIVAAVVAGNNLYGRFIAPKTGSQKAQRQLAGKPLSLPATLPVGRRGTITLFVAKDCHFCRESMDFYRQLATVASEDNTCDLKLVAVGPQARENRGDIVSYLADQKLKVDGADVVDYASLGILGTPTLVLIDSSRLVKNAWAGLLPATTQKDVLARVKSLCR
jgi:hypothetical protein